jgi:phosphoglycerate dehydrogenase-like enzyme
MTNLLILLSLPEPIRHQYRDRLQAAFPQLKIDVVDHRSKVGPYIGETDALITFTPMMSDEVVRNAPRLRWIQTLGTGVDNLVDLPSLGKNVVVTNIHGIHGAPVSEAALCTMLALARGLPRSVRAQDRGEWSRWPPPQLLDRKTVGIFGIGIIAEALAPKCKALGMTVVGITSAKRPAAGFDRVHGRDELLAVVGGLDFLVLLTPLTPETRGIVDARVFAAMKPTSYLINVARGGVVDEAALLAALQSGRIAGAAIDVFVEEPLPASHPFWSCKNALITPHLGGFCDVYVDLAFPTLETNMRCFLAGDIDAMVHVVKRPQAAER